MRRLAILLLLSLPGALVAQLPVMAPLSDSAIDAAIRTGLETKEGRTFATGEAGTGFGASLMRGGLPRYEIYVQGPLARIQTMAATNAKKYLPFTRDSVTDSLRLPFLAVRVVPGKPRILAGQMRQAAPIENVVLQGRGKDAGGQPYPVLQPVAVYKEPVSWGNALGATYSGEAWIALYDLRAVPDADIDVVVVNAGDEFRVRVRRGELADVR